MKVVKITRKEIQERIAAKANEIKKELFEAKVVYPNDVKMNQNDKVGDSEKALVLKNKETTEFKKGKTAEETKMNTFAKEKGSDEKAAAAVMVKAGAEKGGNDATTGLHKANFESKDGNPKVSASDPFVKKAVDEMNTMDALTDEKAKVFVGAGEEKGGTDVTAGQHKAEVKEKAPIVKDKEPIAKGIQLKEAYTKKELVNLIQEEAKKLAKKHLLETELKKIQDEIKNL